MYDAEWDDDEADKSAYVTKDSGRKSTYADGMQRDTTEGKPMFGLIFPKDVPYEEQLLTRLAYLYARGAAKYGDRNWEKSSTPESLGHHEEALWRHFVKFFMGVEDGEDHGAATVWNINAVLLTRRAIKLKAEAEDPGEKMAAEHDAFYSDGYSSASAGAKAELKRRKKAKKKAKKAREVSSQSFGFQPHSLGFQPPGRMVGDDLVIAPDNTVWKRGSVGTQRWYLTDYELSDLPDEVMPKCPAHGNRECEACSQNPDPSRCQCGYFESTGMHWDTCPGRVSAITQRQTMSPDDKLLGRETAEHSMQLDFQQDQERWICGHTIADHPVIDAPGCQQAKEANAFDPEAALKQVEDLSIQTVFQPAAPEGNRHSYRYVAPAINYGLPCMGCGRPLCRLGQARCDDCEASTKSRFPVVPEAEAKVAQDLMQDYHNDADKARLEEFIHLGVIGRGGNGRNGDGTWAPTDGRGCPVCGCFNGGGHGGGCPHEGVSYDKHGKVVK